MLLNSSRPHRLCVLLLTLAALLVACGESAPQRSDTLLVSIRPIALIAQEIAGPQLPVKVLINNGDPHHYAPKVTDRAALERAQLVLWMGPQLEAVLARQLELLPAERQLSLIEAGGYEFNGAEPTDPHLWLRPRNAAVMAAHIAERLAQLQPQNAEQYRQRARDFSRSMANLQKVLDRALWAYKDVPIATTHAAYEQFFGSAGVAVESLSNNSGRNHGARTLLEKSHLRGGCLFGEVPANERDRQTAANLGMRYQALDPLADTLAADAGYRQLIEKLLSDARQCLAQIPDQAR